MNIPIDKDNILLNQYIRCQTEITIDRLLPAIMIWGKNIAFEDIKAPVSNVWMSKGVNPVCLMRTSWSDPDFVNLKLDEW